MNPPVPRRRSMLRAVILPTAALLIAALTGCAGSETGSGTGSETGSAAVSGAATSAQAFPASVEGTYGTVEVEQAPERVVALSTQHAAVLVALGIQPVAVGFAEEDLAEQAPWLEGVLQTTYDPQLSDLAGTTDLNLEKLATYEPDLILGWTYQIPEDVYDQAQELAPTFTALASDGAIPGWDTTTGAVAALTGTDAQPVLDQVEQTCADAAAALPSWQGRTYEFVRPDTDAVMFGGGDAFGCFGLEPADNQVSGETVSYENIDQLDADLLVVFDQTGERATLEEDPRFAELPSSTDGLVSWTDSYPLAIAINTPDPYSWDYLIDAYLPELEDAAA